MTQIRKIWLGEALTIWKMYEPPKVENEDIEENVVDFEDDPGEQLDIRDLEAAQAVLNAQKKTSLEQNDILNLFNR